MSLGRKDKQRRDKRAPMIHERSLYINKVNEWNAINPYDDHEDWSLKEIRQTYFP